MAAETTATSTPTELIPRILHHQLTNAVLQHLQSGISIHKVTTAGHWKPRFMQLREDACALYVMHSSQNTGSSKPSSLFKSLFKRNASSNSTTQDPNIRCIDFQEVSAYWSCGSVGSTKLESTGGVLPKGCSSESDSLIVTIVYGDSNETMDILMSSSDDKDAVLKVLQAWQSLNRLLLHTEKNSKMLISNEALLLRYLWADVDLDKNGLIGQAEFGKLLQRLNWHVPSWSSKYSSHLQGKEGLPTDQVLSMLQKWKQQEANPTDAEHPLQEVWNELVNDSSVDVLRDTDILKWLTTLQGQRNATLADAQQLIQDVNQMELGGLENEEKGSKAKNALSRTRLEAYLYHTANSACAPQTHCNNYFKHPLPLYWISTSHNTYLTGDQLQSYSSVQCYLLALFQRNSKCVEVDCWDGETTKEGDSKPVVYHGHTLTSKIAFCDVIRAVHCYITAHPDTLPIILSLENHCSHAFQRKMAEDLRTILGEALFVPPMGAELDALPSPEQLRGKVVIKGKRPPEDEETSKDVTEVTDVDDDEYDPYDPESGTAKTEQGDSKPLPKIVPELAQLTLFHGTKWKSFETSIKMPTSHMHSISETKLAKLVKKPENICRDWRTYNIRHLTRTYPAGARVDSSNYNPILPWALGCQMVALNLQTCDAAVTLNDGVFTAATGGYVLKPSSVLLASRKDAMPRELSIPVQTQEEDTDLIDPISAVMETLYGFETACNDEVNRQPSSVITSETATRDTGGIDPTSQPVKVLLRILSGSCLPKPKGAKSGEMIDPYVSMTLHDVLEEKETGRLSYTTTTHTTKTVQDNGFCPVWNESKATELLVHSPQVAMLHFALNESDVGNIQYDRVAYAAIPIQRLRTGYRSVPLFGSNGHRTGPFSSASLLVHIAKVSVESTE